jgi:hypothetical protein
MTNEQQVIFDQSKYLILYENVIPVKGYRRNILCDLQREQFEFIPK